MPEQAKGAISPDTSDEALQRRIEEVERVRAALDEAARIANEDASALEASIHALLEERRQLGTQNKEMFRIISDQIDGLKRDLEELESQRSLTEENQFAFAREFGELKELQRLRLGQAPTSDKPS
jgi:hypothetical protein